MATDISTLSTADLVALIGSAAAELARRTEVAPIIELPAVPPVLPAGVLAPTAEDREFVQSCLTQVAAGVYVRAAEKDDYASIAERFPLWFASRNYPTTLRGSTAEAWARRRR